MNAAMRAQKLEQARKIREFINRPGFSKSKRTYMESNVKKLIKGIKPSGKRPAISSIARPVISPVVHPDEDKPKGMNTMVILALIGAILLLGR